MKSDPEAGQRRRGTRVRPRDRARDRARDSSVTCFRTEARVLVGLQLVVSGHTAGPLRH